MQKIILTSALGLANLFAGVQTASADQCYTAPVVTSVYKVKTIQVSCSHYQRTAYDFSIFLLF